MTREEQAAAADYIAELALELTKIALSHQLGRIGHLLEMVTDEAITHKHVLLTGRPLEECA